MRILIAESKTMSRQEEQIPSDVYLKHHPLLDSIATNFMSRWSNLSIEEITSALKVSPAMAAGFIRMARDFSFKGLGRNALEAFTGVVFKSFDYTSLSHEQQEYAENKINIISSLYGWLRGDDIVKPYRLDFNTQLAPTGETMAKYLNPIITPILLDSMRQDNDNEILDLLPSEAAKCLNWRRIKRSMKVVKVEFKSMADGGALKTPHATLLKTMRGRLLRDLVQKESLCIDALMAYESSSMCIDPQSDPDSGKITMLCI